ncbi:MAG: DUF1311 domain-containing protein [Lachnospiraceae bacterium]|jgi:uncharacterized protein YecT (DUF1311 family)|nr:DUF1311 domain-containing protein [Lachnospiraceae bacterium]
MKKYMVLPAFISLAALSVWGCKSKEPEKPEAATAIEITNDQEGEKETKSWDKEEQQAKGQKEKQDKEGQQNKKGQQDKEGQKNETEQKKEGQQMEEASFSFADLNNVEFIFSSGAGGWQTSLTIGENGSFSGLFFDGNLGDTGEGYPNGSVLWSEFGGSFTQPVQEDAYTYSVQLAELEYKDLIGKEEILDEMRYCYMDAYGLSDARTILIHLPGTSLEEIPEEVRSWIGYYDLSQLTDTKLPFFVLENEQHGYAFRGYDMVEELKKTIAYTESQVAEQEKSIHNEALSQMELTEKTGYIYNLWDQALNSTWDVLKKTMDAETMEALTVEERRWIEQKEAAVAEAGAEFEGGSIQSMVMNNMAAELTKARLYELLEWLE